MSRKTETLMEFTEENIVTFLKNREQELAEATAQILDKIAGASPYDKGRDKLFEKIDEDMVKLFKKMPETLKLAWSFTFHMLEQNIEVESNLRRVHTPFLKNQYKDLLEQAILQLDEIEETEEPPENISTYRCCEHKRGVGSKLSRLFRWKR